MPPDELHLQVFLEQDIALQEAQLIGTRQRLQNGFRIPPTGMGQGIFPLGALHDVLRSGEGQTPQTVFLENHPAGVVPV